MWVNMFDRFNDFAYHNFYVADSLNYYRLYFDISYNTWPLKVNCNLVNYYTKKHTDDMAYICAKDKTEFRIYFICG